MDNKNKVLIRQPSLADQVLDILSERISNGTYPPGSQLPTEKIFSSEFSVSMTTIRQAFSRLEDRHLIQRRQGIGTFVSEVLNASILMNQFIEFPKFIAAHGFKPGSKQLSAEFILPTDALLDKLQLDPYSQVLKIRKIFTANDDPIGYVINHIPTWVIEGTYTREEVVRPGVTDNFFEFFDEKCRQPILHFIATVEAESFNNTDMPDMLAHKGPYTPVQIIDQIGYNEDNKPVVSTCEYHTGNWMTFQLIRRRVGY
jgi:GntR family transcriptional regulator